MPNCCCRLYLGCGRCGRMAQAEFGKERHNSLLGLTCIGCTCSGAHSGFLLSFSCPKDMSRFCCFGFAFYTMQPGLNATKVNPTSQFLLNDSHSPYVHVQMLTISRMITDCSIHAGVCACMYACGCKWVNAKCLRICSCSQRVQESTLTCRICKENARKSQTQSMR